jgi:RNA:NAD 2'-phosphotransferase (TPT1/KptA family)
MKKNEQPTNQQLVQISKFMSLVLRHNPGAAGLTLDGHGWVAVLAGAMHAAGHQFYRSANGVWLVDAVPPEFLVFPA